MSIEKLYKKGEKITRWCQQFRNSRSMFISYVDCGFNRDWYYRLKMFFFLCGTDYSTALSAKHISLLRIYCWQWWKWVRKPFQRTYCVSTTIRCASVKNTNVQSVSNMLSNFSKIILMLKMLSSPLSSHQYFIYTDFLTPSHSLLCLFRSFLHRRN